MRIRTYKSFSDAYPERVSGSSLWFYSQVTPCSEAGEVPDFEGKYEGTRLYLFHLDGRVFEPFKQERNVFLERPVYYPEKECFAIIRYDFKNEVVEGYSYSPLKEELILLCSFPMSELGDLINIRFVKEKFTLVKHEIHEDAVEILWPHKRRYQFLPNESLDTICEDKLITSRWIEDPDYREEVIFRDRESGEILNRSKGYLVEMPDGDYWLMTE